MVDKILDCIDFSDSLANRVPEFKTNLHQNHSPIFTRKIEEIKESQTIKLVFKKNGRKNR